MLYPRSGDNEYALLTKWLRNRGGVFRPGDSEVDLWRKLVLLEDPTAQFHGETETALARRFLVALGSPACRGNYPQVLRHIVRQLGISETPADNVWALLAKLVVGGGGGGDPLPAGFTYLLDGDGSQILDGDGSPILVPL